MEEKIAEKSGAVMPTKLTKWENEPTVQDLGLDHTTARADHSNQINKIRGWRDNYSVTGSAKIPKREGKSNVQPKTIKQQAEWRYPGLTEPFLSTPDIFNIYPVTFEDKDAAEQNQLVLNNQINTKMGKTKFINDYVKTAVDEGTVIVRVGWETVEANEIVEYPTFRMEPATEEEVALLQKYAQMEQEGQHVPEELSLAIRQSMETGQPVFPVADEVEKKEEKVIIKNQPVWEVCEAENITIDPSCNGNFDDAKFIVYSFETSKSELEATGIYTNLDKVLAAGTSPLASPDHDSENTTFNFKDEARKKFVAYEYWGFWDINNNGLVEPIVATWVGDVMIRMERNPYPGGELPFVVVPYLLVNKSVYGEPDGALIEDNQNIIGAVTRGMIDIMGRSANGQTGVRKDALDAVNQRKFDKGRDYQFNPDVDPRMAVYTHTFPEIPNSAPLMLQLQNQDAESLTGVRPFAGTNPGAGMNNTTATAARGALDAASKRELSILRRLATGIIEIGRKIIAMNAEFLTDEEVVRITNDNFVSIRRDDLRGDFDLRLTISTAEEDNAKAQELSFMLQTMGNNMDPAMSQIILTDIAKLRKMPDLAKKIEDYQPQPDPMAQKTAEIELQKLLLENKKIELEIAKIQADTGKAHADAQHSVARAVNTEADTDLKNLEFVEREQGVEQARDVEKLQAQSEAQARTKFIEAGLKARAERNK